MSNGVMSMCSWLAWATLLVGFAGFGRAETVEKSINADNFLRRGYHAAAIVDTQLYVYGGLVSYTVNGEPSYNSSSAIQSLDLSTDWEPATAKFNATELPSNVANLSRSILWYHKSEGLLYTGVAGEVATFAWNNNPPQPFGLWSYKPSDGTWNSVVTPQSSTLQGLTRPNQALSGYADDAGFLLNGIDQFGARMGGFLQVDIAAKTLSNSSISADYGSRIDQGSMQFVPIYGAQGLMVAMGGHFFGDLWADMSIIHVYDIVSKTFHNQTATGDIPDGRADYCLSGAGSTASSYEIFYYGGSQGDIPEDAIQYDTIHILTLPAFHWIKVNYPPSSPRSSHTCSNFNNTAQIISLGGADPAGPHSDDGNITSKFIFTRPDPRKQGLGVFDLSSLTWTDKFSPNAPQYVQSDPVKQFYAQAGQSYESGLNPDVANLLRTPRSTSTATASSKSSSSEGSGSHTGAIAGGVVGGVVGLALISGLAFFLLRRRKRNQINHKNQEELAQTEKLDPNLESVAHQNGEASYHEVGGDNSFYNGGSGKHHYEADGKERNHEIDGAGIVEAEAREPARVYEVDGSSAQPRR